MGPGHAQGRRDIAVLETSGQFRQELGRKRLGPTVKIPAKRYEKEHQRFDCGHLGCVQLKRRSYSVPQRATNCGGVT